MKYFSTRNKSEKYNFKEVFLRGLASDGGLFVPENIKKFDKADFLKLKKLTLTIVFYALITNTITLGHFTLSNFKWQISQNSRNIKNHWNFNLDQIILTRRVARIFTFSCYKMKYQTI